MQLLRYGLDRQNESSEESIVSNTPLHYQSLMEVSGRIHRQELSASEVTRALLERIDIHDKTLRANICRNHWRGTLARLFQRVDLIIAPAFSLATPPEAAIRELAAEEDGLVKLTRYTAPYDLSGSPTISIPCGFGAGSVPLGFQLTGRDFGEDVLLRAAHAYQQRTDWHERQPSL